MNDNHLLLKTEIELTKINFGPFGTREPRERSSRLRVPEIKFSNDPRPMLKSTLQPGALDQFHTMGVSDGFLPLCMTAVTVF